MGSFVTVTKHGHSCSMRFICGKDHDEVGDHVQKHVFVVFTISDYFWVFLAFSGCVFGKSVPTARIVVQLHGQTRCVEPRRQMSGHSELYTLCGNAFFNGIVI